METRKIQSVGGGTFTVSLPKEWARAHGIEAGDTVTLHHHLDDVLSIQSPEGVSDDRTPARIRIDHADEERLARTVRAVYRSGATAVRLHAETGFTPEQRRVTDRITRALPGFTVTEDTDTELVLRSLLDTHDVSVRQSVRQLAFVVISMYRDAARAIRTATPTQSTADTAQVRRLHAVIDRSFVRSLTRLDEVDALGLTRPELFELWTTTRELVHVADHAAAIGGLTSRMAPSDDPSLDAVHELVRGTGDVVADAVSVIVDDSDPDLAHSACVRGREIQAACAAFDHQPVDHGATDGHRGAVVWSLSRTASHGVYIAEMGLHRAIRNGDLDVSPPQTEQMDNA